LALNSSEAVEMADLILGMTFCPTASAVERVVDPAAQLMLGAPIPEV